MDGSGAERRRKRRETINEKERLLDRKSIVGSVLGKGVATRQTKEPRTAFESFPVASSKTMKFPFRVAFLFS